jgi:hypothetical protein
MPAEKYNLAAKWFGGVLLPLAVAGYAVSVLIAGQATFRGRYGGVLVLTGFDAGLFAVCIFGLAAAIHCFQFWGNSERLDAYANLGASAALLLFVAALGAVVVRQFLNFV